MDATYTILSTTISRCHAIITRQEDNTWTITDNKVRQVDKLQKVNGASSTVVGLCFYIVQQSVTVLTKITVFIYLVKKNNRPL